MNSEVISEWLASLTASERIRALTLTYSQITVGTRELFLPDAAKEKEQAIMKMLRGVNELHHTLANQLLAYAFDKEGYPLQILDQQLREIANQYRIEGLLTSAFNFARTRNLAARGPEL
jgi:hypothetical protein